MRGAELNPTAARSRRTCPPICSAVRSSHRRGHHRDRRVGCRDRIVPTERHTELVQVLRLGVITTTVLYSPADQGGRLRDDCEIWGRTMSNISAEPRASVIPVRPAALATGDGLARTSPAPTPRQDSGRARRATRSDRIARVDRRRRRIDRSARGRTDPARRRGPDPWQLARPGRVPARTARQGSRAVPLLEVPHDASRLGTDHRGAPTDPARHRRRVLQQLQAQRRSTGHPTRSVPAQDEHRRAPAAVQRAAWRDEPRRPAPDHRRRGRHVRIDASGSCCRCDPA